MAIASPQTLIDPALRKAAQELLNELLEHRLIVIKFRTTHDGDDTWRRAAISSNPEWYSRMCRRELRSRRRYPKPRTIIRRKHTLAALRQIAAGRGRLDSLYVRRLMPFLLERSEQEVAC